MAEYSLVGLFQQTGPVLDCSTERPHVDIVEIIVGINPVLFDIVYLEPAVGRYPKAFLSIM